MGQGAQFSHVCYPLTLLTASLSLAYEFSCCAFELENQLTQRTNKSEQLRILPNEAMQRRLILEPLWRIQPPPITFIRPDSSHTSSQDNLAVLSCR